MNTKLLLGAIIFCSINLHAEQNSNYNFKLEETVISTENFETNVRETAANISIITSEEIEKSAAKDFVDVLKNVPGISVKRYAGTVKFDIRGLNSMYSDRNSLITLDGVPVSSNQVGNLPIESIERIEVIPGGGGILYGDKAIGGVINIITKSPENKQYYGSVYTNYGSNNLRKVGFDYGTKLTENLITEVEYNDYNSDGWRHGEKFETKDARFKGKYLLENGEIEYKYTHSEDEYYKGIAVPRYVSDNDRKDPGRLSKSKEKSNDNYLKWKYNLSNDTEILMYGNYYERENEAFNRKTDEFYRDSDDVRKYLKFQMKHSYLPKSYFILGTDYSREEYKPYSTSEGYKQISGSNIYKWVKDGDSTKDNVGIFVLNKYTYDKFEFTQGARYDNAEYDFYWRNGKLNDPKKIGENDTAKYENYSFELSANYLYSETGSAYLTYTRFFRTPTATEIRYTRNSETLNPQIQDTIELGWKEFIADTYISASTFYKLTNDEIYSAIPPEFSGMVNYNIGNTERIGFELYAEHYINKLTLKSSITYLHHEIVDGNYESSHIPSVPNWKLTAGAVYNFTNNLSVSGDWLYYSKSYDLDDLENVRGESVSGYATFDLAAYYKLQNGLSFTARLENVFDKKYDEYTGYWDDTYENNETIFRRQYYPAIGRTITIGMKYEL